MTTEVIVEADAKRPVPGQVVRVRTRTYLVEAVDSSGPGGEGTLVRMACLDDDAQGDPLEVI